MSPAFLAWGTFESYPCGYSWGRHGFHTQFSHEWAQVGRYMSGSFSVNQGGAQSLSWSNQSTKGK